MAEEPAPKRHKQRPRNVLAERVGCSKEEASEALRNFGGDMEDAGACLSVFWLCRATISVTGRVNTKGPQAGAASPIDLQMAG